MNPPMQQWPYLSPPLNQFKSRIPENLSPPFLDWYALGAASNCDLR